ncbi:hypothetical protein Nepgr_005336 [Nepenthes gracilis]|uniref:Secreted protein n=1 Tax=Nepenthes gracilis TaxID=150966 RepID=A0AAD3S3F4_NEPGR|nr:hypothetical protein Nepgr_005336 [Nepenthes gracilis]
MQAALPKMVLLVLVLEHSAVSRAKCFCRATWPRGNRQKPQGQHQHQKAFPITQPDKQSATAFHHHCIPLEWFNKQKQKQFSTTTGSKSSISWAAVIPAPAEIKVLGRGRLQQHHKNMEQPTNLQQQKIPCRSHTHSSLPKYIIQ